MIQLNLLPDVKLEYVKAQRTRRIILSVTTIISIAAVAVLIVVFGAYSYQKKHLSDITKSINTNISTLQNKPNINNILTVQNQLASINGLHDTKFNSTSIFDDLNALTPAQVSIDNFTIDFTKSTMIIGGNTDTLQSVNQYVDILKNTMYSTSVGSNKAAFSDIVLANFGISTTTPPISYTINLNFDPAIFDITQNIKLIVPPEVITRVHISQPSDLFQNSPTSTSNSSGNGQ